MIELMAKVFSDTLDRNPRTLLYLTLFLGAFFPGIAYFKDEPLVAQWFISMFVTLLITLCSEECSSQSRRILISAVIESGMFFIPIGGISYRIRRCLHSWPADCAIRGYLR